MLYTMYVPADEEALAPDTLTPDGGANGSANGGAAPPSERRGLLSAAGGEAWRPEGQEQQPLPRR